MIKNVITTDFVELEQRIAKLWANPPIPVQSDLLDLHTITAALTLRIPYSQVTREERNRVGKPLNFAALYSPSIRWVLPDEATLMGLWTEQEKNQLCFDFKLARPSKLYETLSNHFSNAYGIA